jgi:hypothetical protein
MAKRQNLPADRDGPEAPRHAKRQRIEEPAEDQVEKVTSARQLQNLLLFQQDSARSMGNGMLSSFQ